MKIIIVMCMVVFGLTANAGWIGNLIFYNIGKNEGESECRAQNAELVELRARVELLESIIANHPEAQKELDIAEQESESKDTKPIDALTIIVVVTMVAAIVIGGFMSDWLMVKRRQERKRRISELSQWNVVKGALALNSVIWYTLNKSVAWERRGCRARSRKN